MTDKLLYKFVRIPDTDENVIYTDDPVFRVLYDEKVKWQLVKPFSFEWNFEELSGDYIDSVVGNIINDAGHISRIPSIHPELGQAIELDAGFEILTSELYPIQFFNGAELNSFSVNSIELKRFGYENYINPEGVELNNFSAGKIDLTSIAITYEVSPEGVELNNFSAGKIDLVSIAVIYTSAPEGIEIDTFSVGKIDIVQYGIVSEIEPEGAEINTFSVGKIDLTLA